MKYSEIIKVNNELKKNQEGPEYTIALISNITVNQLVDILEFSVRSEGINTNCQVGQYDNIVQDAAEFKNKSLVIIFWELANLVDGLQYKADLMSETEINDLIEKLKKELTYVFKTLESTSHVVMNKFSSLLFNYVNIEENNLDFIANELNEFIEKSKPANTMVVNIDKVIAKVSIEKSMDLRYYYTTKALYSIEFYKAYSNYILPIIRSLNGKTKKALIFDCDNTLWKGIVGEDGFDSLALTSHHKSGTPYEEVQALAKILNRKGILLGLCSKNNLTDVEEVFDFYEDMMLQKTDLTIKRVNWNDKVTNLKDISNSLNIGLDSLVFVDDSDFEINYVSENLPEVVTLKVPERSTDYPLLIRENLGLFYNLTKTKEDIQKVKMYSEQLQREETRGTFENLESYIESLGIELKVYVDEAAIVPRMSQMTQKTNQFNLTTKRYSEADISRFIQNPNSLVMAFGVRDKFGDSGITGLVIVNADNVDAEVDTFLMSCRIIGRNIEYKIFDYLAAYLIGKGIKRLFAKYIKTQKNGQVEGFYEKMGFNLDGEEEKTKAYSLELVNYNSHQINYMTIND